MSTEDRQRLDAKAREITFLGMELLQLQKRVPEEEKRVAIMRQRLTDLPGLIELAKVQQTTIRRDIEQNGARRERQKEIKQLQKRLQRLQQQERQRRDEND